MWVSTPWWWVRAGFTFNVVLCDVAVLVQDLLHAAQRDGCKVPRVLQLQQPLQVHGSLAPPQVNALAVLGIQPQNANRHSSGWGNSQGIKQSSCFPMNYLISVFTEKYFKIWLPENLTHLLFSATAQSLLCLLFYSERLCSFINNPKY